MPSATPELKSEILRAGAGAGKTTTLTNTFLKFAIDFKEKNKKFPRIVVTTFTRKATQELKERLLSKSLEEGREDLFHYVSSKSQVHISTIHGVLSLFLSRYGASIGLTPDYKLVDDGQVRKKARQIIRKYLLEDEKLQELLEEYEFEAIEKSLLRYFTERIQRSDLKFASIEDMQLEAKRKVRDTVSRIRRVCQEIVHSSAEDKWIVYCQNILNIESNIESDTLSLFLSRVEDFFENNSKPIFRKGKAPFAQSLHDEFDESRKELQKIATDFRFSQLFFLKHQKNCELFLQLAERFSQDFLRVKLEDGILSMGDLETLAFKIIKEVPDSANKFSQEWDFWMIDEYQDTSPIQVELLQKLVGSRPEFVVGDPQQSIYLFRGARSEVFQNKIKDIQSGGGVVSEKLTNYRSTPEVLSFFNFYFTQMSNRFSEMTPAPEKVRSINKEPAIQVLICDEHDEIDNYEVNTTVARVQELLASGTKPEEICVLGRTHRVLENIAKAAISFGVPVQLHSGAGFYERREVIDAMSILKFLINPHDNVNFVMLLRSPWLNLSDSEITNFCHSKKQSFWVEALGQKSNVSDNHPIAILRKLLSLSLQMGIAWTFRISLVELGLIDFSSLIDPTGRREANIWKLVSLLSEKERSPGFNYLEFLNSGLSSISVDEGSEDSDATPVVEPKRVNFMTVHASKGLQFEHVILPGMGQDPRNSQAPLFSVDEDIGVWTLKIRSDETQSMVSSLWAEKINSALQERETEEYLRVLYVALTRAKCGVSLVWEKEVGKKSWASLCPLELDEGLHEMEGFSYVVRVGNLNPTKMMSDEIVLGKVRDEWVSDKTVHLSRNLSITEILQARSKNGVDKARSNRDLHDAAARAQQGVLAHSTFESLKYTDYQTLSSICDETLKKPLQFVVDTDKIPLQEIIQNGQVEWGFAFKYNNSILQGQIDLWGVVDQELWVVDYKTGSQRFAEKAFQQLEFYCWILHKMGLAKAVSGINLAVVYPNDEEVKVKNYQRIDEIKSQIESLIKV